MARPAPASVLTALGFPAEVDRVYRRLLSQSGRELDRVAASMLRSPAELLTELALLLETGIVRMEEDLLLVAPPAEALRIMVAAQSAHAERSHRRLDGIAEALRLLADHSRTPTIEDAAEDTGEPIEGELFTGGDILALIRSMVLHGPGDLRWLRPDQWRSPREERMAALVGEALDGTGRTSRAIYPVHALHDAPRALRRRIAVGEQIRVLPELSTRLLVIGDTIAVLPEPLGYADAPLAVVRQRGLVDALGQWFDLLWERAAVPSLVPGPPPPDSGVAMRRFLLQQLAAGAHDEQIARKLGISLRTVRRRVADLMSELGADTRFQAGVEAVRRGWL